MRFSLARFVLPGLLALVACAAPPAVEARHPPLGAGCPVQVFEQPPPMAIANLGTVRARCAPDVSRDDCIRELQDQACRLGGDVVWGVSSTARVVDEKNEWSGRAAHTE